MLLRMLHRPMPPVLLASIILAQPGATAGQQNDRFRQEGASPASIGGLTAVQATSWRRTVEQVVAVLRAQPDVTAPPPGVCTLLTVSTGGVPVAGRLVTAVRVGVPVSWNAEKGCAGISNSGVSVHINDAGGFIEGGLGELTDEDWETLRVTPAPEGSDGAASLWFDQYDRWAVITRGTTALLDTLSQEEYLRRRIADMEQAGATVLVTRLRARLDALAPAERAAPACFEADDLLAALTTCGAGGRAHVTLNRMYFDAGLPPEAVQLIVIASARERRGKEDPRHFALRSRIFEGLDLGALADLVHP